MFLLCLQEEVSYVVVQGFDRYYSFCLQRQKRMLTVLFLEYRLLTSSEMYLFASFFEQILFK